MSAIDFSDDPRAVLIHFNEKHDRLGRFAKKSGGSTTKSIYPYGNYEVPDGEYHNPMDAEIANSGGKDGLLTPRLKAMEETYKMFKRIYNGGSGSFSDVINKSIDAYIKPESIRDSSYLRSKIGNDRYHPPEDFLNAAAAVSDFIWRDMLTGYRQLLADEEIEYKLEEGSIDNKEAWDEFATALEENGVKKMLVQEVGKRFGELYENQQHHGYDEIEDQAREKEKSGSAKIKKRAMNAEQAYKLASEQRHKDIQKKQEADGAANAYAKASEQRRKDLEKKLKHVDYTDDPRAVLVHFNENHDRLGRFAKKSGGVSSSDRSKNIFLQSVGGNGLRLGDYLRSEGGVRKREHFEVNAIIPKMVDAYLSPENIDSLISDSSFVRDRIGGKELHTFSDYDAVGSYVKDLVRNDVKAGAYELADILKLRDETPPFMRDSNYTKTGNTIVAPSNVFGVYDTTDEEKREQVSRFMSVALENGMESVLTDAVNANLLHLYLHQPKFGDDYLEEDAQAAREHWNSPETHRDDLKAYNAEDAYRNVSKQRAKDIQNNTAPKSASEAYAAASAQRNRDLTKKLKHVDYTDDPRAVLIHRGGGNPYHDPKTGQFTTGTGFGMGRYVDKDGNLTEQGQKRLENALKKNARKKKDDRVKPPEGMTVADVLKDPHQWVTDDLTGIETSLKSASSMAGDVERFVKNREAKKPLVRKKKLNLDDMTDAELQAKINRYILEQRYQDTFNPKEPPEVSTGKKFLINTLEYAGSVLAIGASAVTIAKAIHEMKKE